MDPKLKQLMKELGDAINESLSDSEQISGVVSRIKESGYDISLHLEATIGVSKRGEKAPDKTSFEWKVPQLFKRRQQDDNPDGVWAIA